MSDFAHLIGANRPRASALHDSEKTRTYRKGVFQNLKAALKNPTAFPDLERMVYGCRVAPAGVFSLLWTVCLAWLEANNEVDAAALLKAHYLEKTADGLWEASWRHAPTRILPGTASGSQAQEAWHMSRLIPGVSGLKQPLPDFIADLRSFVGCRADQLAKQTNLYQVPGLQWDPELWAGVVLLKKTNVPKFNSSSSYYHIFSL